MEIKCWSDNLNTGIPLIDVQHKTLIDLTTYFHSLDESELDAEKVDFIITSIETYTLYHFSTEEKFFEKCNYLNKELHIKKHSELREILNELKNLKDTTKHCLLIGILHSLNFWFYNHMINDDPDYVEQLKSHLKNGSQ